MTVVPDIVGAKDNGESFCDSDYLVAHARCTAETGRTLVIDESGSVSLQKHIGADEPYLSGHYPGNPVYPGVFHIDLALILLTEITEGRARLRAIEKVRFMHPLRPGDTVRVTATEITADDSTRRFRFLGVDDNDTKVFTMAVRVSR